MGIIRNHCPNINFDLKNLIKISQESMINKCPISTFNLEDFNNAINEGDIEKSLKILDEAGIKYKVKKLPTNKIFIFFEYNGIKKIVYIQPKKEVVEKLKLPDQEVDTQKYMQQFLSDMANKYPDDNMFNSYLNWILPKLFDQIVDRYEDNEGLDFETYIKNELTKFESSWMVDDSKENLEYSYYARIFSAVQNINNNLGIYGLTEKLDPNAINSLLDKLMEEKNNAIDIIKQNNFASSEDAILNPLLDQIAEHLVSKLLVETNLSQTIVHLYINGYDENGFDKNGYDKNGYDRNGYDKDGFNKDGFDKNGYDRNGYDKDGFNKEGYKVETQTQGDTVIETKSYSDGRKIITETKNGKTVKVTEIDADGKRKETTYENDKVTEEIKDKNGNRIQTSIRTKNPNGVEYVDVRMYNGSNQVSSRTVTYYFDDRTEEYEYNTQYNPWLVTNSTVTYKDGKVSKYTFTYPDLKVDTDGKTILNPKDYTRVRTCDNGDIYTEHFQNGVVVKTSSYNKATNKTYIYEFENGKKVRGWVQDHNKNTVKTLTFDSNGNVIDNKSAINNITISSSGFNISGSAFYNGLKNLDSVAVGGFIFNFTFRECINYKATGSFSTPSISVDLMELANPANQSNPNAHTKKIKASKVYNGVPSDRADADKIANLLETYCNSNGLGYTPNMLTGYLFNNDSTFCQSIKGSGDFKNFVKSNFEALKNGNCNKSLNFNSGDLFYALHGTNIADSYMDGSGNLHITIFDMYDFATAQNLNNNSSTADKLNAIGDALMKNGEWKPYYMIFEVVVTAAELKAMGINV